MGDIGIAISRSSRGYGRVLGKSERDANLKGIASGGSSVPSINGIAYYPLIVQALGFIRLVL